jgi:hypothetical protein
MLASRRWRDWNPPAIFQECPERELTKPTEPLSSPVLSFLSVPTLPVSKINAPSASTDRSDQSDRSMAHRSGVRNHSPRGVVPSPRPIHSSFGNHLPSNVAGGAAGVKCLQNARPVCGRIRSKRRGWIRGPARSVRIACGCLVVLSLHRSQRPANANSERAKPYCAIYTPEPASMAGRSL